jgi:hypothetical protein
MRLISRRGHQWAAIGADAECLWCGDPFIAYTPAPFCCTEHRLAWNDRRRPRRPGVMSTEVAREIVERFVRVNAEIEAVQAAQVEPLRRRL